MSEHQKPKVLYIWLVPSEHVLEQPGSWRIRKWDTDSFPEANFIAYNCEVSPTATSESEKS